MGKNTQGKKPVIHVFSAGGVVFKNNKGKVLWLVTKSTPSLNNKKPVWRLPKGWLDDRLHGKLPGPKTLGKIRATEEEIKESALREVKEEGGVGAKIVEKIGTERVWRIFLGQRELKFITYYLMEWMKDLSEGPDFETSEIAWLSYVDARERLSYLDERKILDKANEILGRLRQQGLI